MGPVHEMRRKVQSYAFPLPGPGKEPWPRRGRAVPGKGSGRGKATGAIAVIATCLTLPALADDTHLDSLGFPADCTLGRTCFIQQYVDRDPGPGIADFTCGTLTYDGHSGTDIRLKDDAAMTRGVAVLSASDGVVLGLRDGMRDQRQGTPGAPDISNRDCGNGMLIEQADGMQLQYCHLRRGSIAVRKGDLVTQGQVLGQIGLSGRTQFPHLHLTVRSAAGAVIDPFDARQQDASCTFPDREDLWRDLDASDYQPGGLLDAGFSRAVPEYDAIRQGGAANDTLLDRDAPALVYWVHYFGLRNGDAIGLTLMAPDGSVIAQSSHRMKKDRAVEFRAAGRKARGPWPSGDYTGVTTLTRDGAVIERSEHRLSLP